MVSQNSASHSYSLPSASQESSYPQVQQNATENFIDQFRRLPHEAQIAIIRQYGPQFLEQLEKRQLHTIQDPNQFFSVCYVLAQQPSLAALEAWISIPRGNDTTEAHYVHNSIDISISRQMRYTTCTIRTRIRDGVHYIEPRLQLYGSEMNAVLDDNLDYTQLEGLFPDAQEFSQESAITDPDGPSYTPSIGHEAGARGGPTSLAGGQTPDSSADHTKSTNSTCRTPQRSDSLMTLHASDGTLPQSGASEQGDISRTPTSLYTDPATEGWEQHSFSKDRHAWEARSRKNSNILPSSSFGRLTSVEQALADAPITAVVNGQKSTSGPVFWPVSNTRDTRGFMERFYGFHGISPSELEGALSQTSNGGFA